jgi:metallo-beta-lactamase family protein
MHIRFFGAAREVTGSKHLLTINGKQLLLDCGMSQGKRKESEEKNRNLPFDARDVDAMALSHAHIDHSGLIPLLIKKGFKKSVYATNATKDVAKYMLADSASIQEREVEYLRKKNKQCEDPIYTVEDAEKAMEHFVGKKYNEKFEIFSGVQAEFLNAGHILGSAITYLTVDDKETKSKYTVAFTGDLGRKGLPLLKDPDYLPQTDYLIIEATYGNRLHSSLMDMESLLEEYINKTVKRGGKIIIPAFALERTQEIVYLLNILTKEGKIPEIPIFVDSPLSGNLTEVFMDHLECLDEETNEEFLKNKENPFGFGRLRYTASAEESKKLNDLNGPAIIIAASGMCEHGRILHHLKNNIENRKNIILLVGYQAANTLGRKLLDGQKSVNIFGDPYNVEAEVKVMDGFSAHADRSDLLDYIQRIKGLKKIFLVHAEEGQGLDFAEILKEHGFGNLVEVPLPGQEFMIG